MPPDRPQHPSSIDLSRFLEGSLPGPQAREIVRHLLAGCPRCRKEADRLHASALLGLRKPPDARR